jgi:hypothetical protein
MLTCVYENHSSVERLIKLLYSFMFWEFMPPLILERSSTNNGLIANYYGQTHEFNISNLHVEFSNVGIIDQNSFKEVLGLMQDITKWYNSVKLTS